MLWQEAQIVRERVNSRLVSDAVILHTVISAHMAKDGHKGLTKLLKDLQNG